MMRLGLVGPASGDEEALREALELALGPLACDQVLYLGMDGAAARVLDRWAVDLVGEDASEEAFLREAARLAVLDDPARLEGLLAADALVRRLDAVRTLPPAPARVVEMIDDRIVLLVHDKAVLDEEDIANAHLVVYGKGKESTLKRFGPRAFFTPGPISGRKIGVLEQEEDGKAALCVYGLDGKAVMRESLAGRTGKLTVAT